MTENARSERRTQNRVVALFTRPTEAGGLGCTLLGVLSHQGLVPAHSGLS